MFVPRAGVYKMGSGIELEESSYSWPSFSFLQARTSCLSDGLRTDGRRKAVRTGVLTPWLMWIDPSECSNVQYVHPPAFRPKRRYWCEFRSGKTSGSRSKKRSGFPQPPIFECPHPQGFCQSPFFSPLKPGLTGVVGL